MTLDRTRFEQFWNLFVEDAKGGTVLESDPMVISNGVSPHLAEALLRSAERKDIPADCLTEDWI